MSTKTKQTWPDSRESRSEQDRARTDAVMPQLAGVSDRRSRLVRIPFAQLSVHRGSLLLPELRLVVQEPHFRDEAAELFFHRLKALAQTSGFLV